MQQPGKKFGVGLAFGAFVTALLAAVGVDEVSAGTIGVGVGTAVGLVLRAVWK